MAETRSEATGLRSRVTRKMLWEALFSLLEEDCFEQISVRDICARSQVNRSTFYNHFDSKYDLLHYGIETIIPEEFNSVSPPRAKLDRSQEGPHRALFEYVYRHPKFWENLLVKHGISDEVFNSMLKGTMKFLSELDPSNDDSRFLEIEAQMYIGAVGNLTVWWLKNNCETPIDKLCFYVDELWRYRTHDTRKGR